MFLQSFIDNGILERVDNWNLKVNPIKFKWAAIFFRPPEGGMPLHPVTDEEWNKLKSLGFGITSCILRHNTTHITDVICEGKHPNINPNTNQFCMSGDMEYSEKTVDKIVHSLGNPNFQNWFASEWGVDVWKPVIDIISNSNESGKTIRIL